jgi:hypothetical protein
VKVGLMGFRGKVTKEQTMVMDKKATQGDIARFNI